MFLTMILQRLCNFALQLGPHSFSLAPLGAVTFTQVRTPEKEGRFVLTWVRGCIKNNP
jgi:hypothetical protein